jgi:HlyD family secretion protein
MDAAGHGMFIAIFGVYGWADLKDRLDRRIIMGMDRTIKKKTWTPKRIALLAGGILFVAFAVYVFLFKFRTSSLNVEKERITISAVTKGPFQEFIPIMGNVLPKTVFFLDAAEGGRVDELYMEAGTMVKKGDPILRLTNTDLLLTIMWREAELFQQSNNLRSTRLSLEQYRLELSQNVAQAETALQQQKRLYDRYTELIKDDLISQHDYETSKDQYEYLQKRRDLTEESQKTEIMFRQAQVDALETSLKRMQDNLDIARGKLENLTIKAPVTGYLTALNAEIGQAKSPGDKLGQIDVIEGFKVRAGIDELYKPRVEAGKTGDFELAGKTYTLSVRKVFPEVKDGKFDVDMDFTGGEPVGITRGQTLHIRLNLGGISDAILLPRGGFYQTTGGNWVFVVDKSGKFAVKRSIKLNRQNPQDYEVSEGLQPGEQVVTSSYESFGDVERLILK